MMPFSFSGKGDNAADLEKEISAFVDSGLAKKQSDIWNAASPSQQGKPVASTHAPANPAAKPKKQLPPPDNWTIVPHTTKRGVTGRIVRVGPFSAWIPKGDVVKAEACVTAINEVFRKAICTPLVDAIRSESVK